MVGVSFSTGRTDGGAARPVEAKETWLRRVTLLSAEMLFDPLAGCGGEASDGAGATGVQARQVLSMAEPVRPGVLFFKLIAVSDFAHGHRVITDVEQEEFLGLVTVGLPPPGLIQEGDIQFDGRVVVHLGVLVAEAPEG